jgi:N-acetyl-alpha-D-glucosaminyl L-malate synthase BshA
LSTKPLLRIGIVCYPTFGGSGVLATELANHLAEQGHQVHVLSYAQPVRLNAYNPNLYYHEVQVENYPLFQYQPYELALSSAMVSMVERESLDVLHVHYAIPHAYAAYMARKILEDKGQYLPVVTTLHGTDITLVGKHPTYHQAVCFSIEHSSAVTAVSDSLKADTIELFDIKRTIEVVPNFVDSKRFFRCEGDRQIQLSTHGEWIISHVSNFRKVKRISDVIDIFERIQAKVPAKLIMVGDGPERTGAEQHVKALGLTGKVLFAGKTTEVNHVLGQSDLFLLPSESESFGLAALEAMASYVPVIASKSGGLPEVVTHGVNGYLEAVGDVDAMAARALEILKDRPTQQGFANAARKSAEGFSVTDVADEYLAIYRRVIHG